MNIHKTEQISVFASSPHVQSFSPEIVVTLPTFKRPDHLLATLGSIASQRTKRPFAVIVMENDAEGLQGAQAAAPLFEAGQMNGHVIVAHERGNCHAYNAGWKTAMQRFPGFSHLMVIDDDEIADPGWMENHLAAAGKFDADITGGPQVPIFSDSTLQAFENHPVFSPPYDTTGPVGVLYSSGNLCLRRRVLEEMAFPYLDLRFNFMGGGDSDFLSRASQSGFRLAWCAEAVVRETMPARRTEADWLRARAIRNGIISTLVERRKRTGEPLGGLRTMTRSVALLTASPLRAIARLAAGSPLSAATYPVLVGLGRIMGEFGYVNEQYRDAEKN